MIERLDEKEKDNKDVLKNMI
jgi:hypothetical protein